MLRNFFMLGFWHVLRSVVCAGMCACAGICWHVLAYVHICAAYLRCVVCSVVCAGTCVMLAYVLAYMPVFDFH